MNITICRSFNFDTVIEPITTITYANPFTTQASDNRFSIVQNDVEPSMVLKFYDVDNAPISFASALNIPSYSLSCALGFKTTLLNQLNSTVTQVISSYDSRFDNLCYLSIDSEKIQITNSTHNKVLNQSYLTVKRNIKPDKHYRNSAIRVVRSNPVTEFLDATQGIIKIHWSRRDVSLVGIYELELTFDRSVSGVRSKWTVSPIDIEVREEYSLG